jgi:hypothetical protein
MNQLPITIAYIVDSEGHLIPNSPLDKIRESTYKESLKRGQIIEITYEVQVQDGSYGQISKVHACARQLSVDTRASFSDMKIEIKKKAGLVAANGDVKSFADCSKEELSLAIQAAIEIGDIVGCNLHHY